MSTRRQPKGPRGGQFATSARASQVGSELSLRDPWGSSTHNEVDFANLDEETRDLMVEEILADAENGKLYISARLRESGAAMWPDLLAIHARGGDPQSLANRTRPLLETHTATGRRMPDNAPEYLAFSEFNRYYMRAVCLRAAIEGRTHVRVCRARHPKKATPSSEQMLGEVRPAVELLDYLRSNDFEENPSYGRLGRGGSGISVELVHY